MGWLPGRITWQWQIWIGFGGLFVLAWIRFRKTAAHFVFLAVLFLTPFLGELLVSLWRPVFYDRTLIWSTIPLYLLLAAGISQLRYRSYILTVMIILVTLSWLSITNYYVYLHKERWDLAARYVSDKIQQGDIILFNAGWTEIPFDYYFARYHHPNAEYGLPVTLFERGELEPRMTASDLPYLHQLIDGQARIWLVYSHNWWTDPESLIPQALEEQHRLEASRMLNGMQVMLYSQK
jgi:hypothetical protein